MQPVLQDRVAVSWVAAFAAIDPERDVGPVPDGIAQCLQPAERGLFGIRLGEASTHRHVPRWSEINVRLFAWRQLRACERIRFSPPLSSPRRRRLSGNWLHRGCACFETRPRALLSMREVVDGITGIPHPEEAAERLSRRTHGVDPANRQFHYTFAGRRPFRRGTNIPGSVR